MGRLSGGGMLVAAIVLIVLGILALTGKLDWLLDVLGVIAVIAGGALILMNLMGRGGKKSSGGYDGDY